ncbi:MAG TPA: dTDP-4-dehydrorhamnose 3,5-epimerase family protein, partial [Actinomycetota bacterium]
MLGTPRVYGDSRGSFMEIFREDLLGVAFVQANHSRSSKGVLR